MIRFVAQVLGVGLFLAAVAWQVAVSADRSRRHRERARARRRK